jgi:hypothetical protein
MQTGYKNIDFWTYQAVVYVLSTVQRATELRSM